MTPEPGASVFEQLRAFEGGLAMQRVAAEKEAETIEQAARLAKARAAHLAQLEEDFQSTVALLPRGPGRPLDEIPPNFVQEILRLRDERGWGRPRILGALREFGVTDRQVRRVLAEAAGRKPSARRRSS